MVKSEEERVCSIRIFFSPNYGNEKKSFPKSAVMQPFVFVPIMTVGQKKEKRCLMIHWMNFLRR